jgi:integrase
MPGHIRRRGARSWEIKLESGVDPTTGKRKTVYRSVKGTKKQAESALVKLLNEAASGRLVDATKETLGAFLTRWDRDWAAHNVSPKTRERWGQLIAVQIAPLLGNASIQRVEPVHLAELYSQLMREGSATGGPLAPRTVGSVHRLLRRAFGHAVTWKLLKQNPAAEVHPPKVNATEIEIPSEDEIAAVLAALEARELQLYVLAVLALATGARRGELCGLVWGDLDLDAGTLRITRSVEQTRAGLRIKTPKTTNGRRTIGVSPRQRSRRYAPIGRASRRRG